MSRGPRRSDITVKEVHPMSLKASRARTGQYEWKAEEGVKEPHESGENEFSTLATKARDAATSKSPEVVSLLPEPAFSIEYGGHVLGRVILGHEKTIIRVGNSCKVRIEDPAISSFLINKVIGPLCSRLQAGWNIVEADGYLREIVIDKPLFGEDAVEVIKAAKWALAKAFSRPLRGWGSRRHHREMHVGWGMNEGGRMPRMR
jgi:hypothetical protein